ncbi:PEP/pyruvate-binding domain-containing protein [Bosea sp. RAC05]|uniref:PEP/pyruvate-binding domain-containing protein n=1 Tax=Bosea sp. RAC05 TaxID=1842539 RepID=UPI0008572027|nr:PEP/pyruvate-binding domain-containing protein [Bosea sp. RAC05]AOG08050.1 PEP-utilizing enzyme, mobile domain protein [Bosea sp. RAC05]
MSGWVLQANDSGDPAVSGGKAAALSALSRAGFDVPPFVVILPEGLSARGLKPDVRKSLESALAELGPGPFAVRSSGRDEDGSSHSHAGQFLSLLEIAAPDVPAAALKVWRSGSTESLRAYRASRGLDPAGGAPAIIVQRLVRARAAGVAFSADPVAGRRDRFVISAIAGLGDRLVGGEADGDDYVLDASGHTVLQGPEAGVLTATDLAALGGLIARVAAVRGSAQDLEWAFEEDQLFLLQARPITTGLREPTLPDPMVTIFDNSNIVESYPGLVSPLTYSFAQYAYARVYRRFVALLGVAPGRISESAPVFDNMLGRVDGRVYYNLVNWYRALALLPGFSLNRAHMETMMGVSEPLPAVISASIGPPPARGFAKVAEFARMGRAGFGLAFEAMRLKRTIRGFYARLNGALRVRPDAIAAMPLSALATEYRTIEAGLLDRWDAPLINDFLCMIAFGASRKLLERWCGPEGIEIHNAVMIGQGDIVSAEPARRIAAMGALAAGKPKLIEALQRGDLVASKGDPALAREIDAYLAKFSDRCTEELKLESITLDQDPAPLLAAIAAAALTPRAAHVRGEDGAAALDRVLKEFPVRRRIAHLVMGWARDRVRDRENLRFERTRIFGHARRVLVAMGRQLAALDAIEAPRDVFLLTVPELLGAIEGFGTTADLKGLVATRKAEMARAAERPDPPERITVTGAAGLSSAVAAASAATPAGAPETIRKGTGCSAGLVRARARVIRDPRRDALVQGEILVARHTDPGWIAVFSNASAIVVERGSLLSHSAIVAREMGIPCVVGLKGALDWIVDGEMISVEGASGEVRKTDG